jgi:hypothetical protein
VLFKICAFKKLPDQVNEVSPFGHSWREGVVKGEDDAILGKGYLQEGFHEGRRSGHVPPGEEGIFAFVIFLIG